MVDRQPGLTNDESRDVVATMRILRVGGIRALEAAALALHPEVSLMERAGEAVARIAITMTNERLGPMLILCGPGNNGGDALVAARVLRDRGVEVRVALLDAPERYRGDAAVAWSRWSDTSAHETIDPADVIGRASLVVDGLFGTGANRAPAGKARDWVALVNASHVPVLAIDVASGVDADTGQVADLAIEADRTISFIAGKPGLYTGDGLDHAGVVTIDPLGIERDGVSVDEMHFEVGQSGTINRPALFPTLRTPRKLNSHKGSNGSVAVIGGDHGMVGAALMSSRMALHAGAGRVYVRLLASDAPSHDVLQPELMLRDSLDGVDATALAIGPGLGDSDVARSLLSDWLMRAPALAVDADALNAIAKDAELGELLVQRARRGMKAAVLTPHPLEAARLFGCDANEIQRDRIVAATTLAAKYASVVVLKGAGTIIAEPSGSWVINTTGNPSLGTGGTGDVLCGLVAALLAQNLLPVDAARAAVWLHGRAADDLVAAGIGPVGLVATELIPAIRTALNRARSASFDI
jgi:hydroxyethylthiazole kinase-like uncharacterized protein yjeF